MKVVAINLLGIALCYALFASAVFLLAAGFSPFAMHLGEAIFLAFPISFLFFWVGYAPAAFVWLTVRKRLWLACLGSMAVLCAWGGGLALLSSYQIKPGHFGRAVEDGMPTIHYFLNLVLEFGVSILLYEVVRHVRRSFKRRLPTKPF